MTKITACETDGPSLAIGVLRSHRTPEQMRHSVFDGCTGVLQ